jgi:hypothetical protein
MMEHLPNEREYDLVSEGIRAQAQLVRVTP